MKDEKQTDNPGAMVLERVKLDSSDGIHLGPPQSFGSLTVVPVFHEAPTAEYIPYASVMTTGLVEVREVAGGGEVNTLVATNRGQSPVLLLESEILEGMQQTRVLNITIMVPALATINIPVSCVEAGRWNATSAAARKHDYHMSPRARRRKSATVLQSARATGTYASDQAEVWMSVSDELAAHHVESRTQEQAEIGRQRGVDIQHAMATMVPLPTQCGVIAVLGGKPLCLDLFDRASTLSAVWAGLAGSYALDALTVAEAALPERDLERATAWVRALQESVPTAHRGVGLGTNVGLSSPHAGGTGLVVGDALVHLGAFATESAGSRFSAPSRRARRGPAMSGRGPDSLVDRALEIALTAHRGWPDKGGRPYILHPLRLMAQMSTDDERLVAILHDVLEDGDVTADDLRRAGMPEPVVVAVERLTRPKGRHDYQRYIAALRDDPLARRVKIADLEDNLDLRRLETLDAAAVARTNKYLEAWRTLTKD